MHGIRFGYPLLARQPDYFRLAVWDVETVTRVTDDARALARLGWC
jgi:hypothetical protein